MNPFTAFTSTAVLLPVDDIDTDQIIPARFLKATEKTGMGNNLFADWRFNADGSPKPAFVLNRPQSQNAGILIAGSNFGCGSSREHAPWALLGYGFRAVVATSFGDIFRNNALKNGLLPVQVTPQGYRTLLELFEESPQAPLTVDLAGQTLVLPGGERIGFPIDEFSKTCLLNGVDELGYLLAMDVMITAYENMNRDPYRVLREDAKDAKN